MRTSKWHGDEWRFSHRSDTSTFKKRLCVSKKEERRERTKYRNRERKKERDEGSRRERGREKVERGKERKKDC